MCGNNRALLGVLVLGEVVEAPDGRAGVVVAVADQLGSWR